MEERSSLRDVAILSAGVGLGIALGFGLLELAERTTEWVPELVKRFQAEATKEGGNR